MGRRVSEYSYEPFEVLCSVDFEDRARSVAEICGSAFIFLSETLGFQPRVSLKLLAEDDWNEHVSGFLYGMPNYSNRALVIAAERADWWIGLIDLIRIQAPDVLPEMEAVYGDGEGGIDLTPFFDLVALHELGHAFHVQYPFQFPRLWLQELFATLCKNSFIAEFYPELLPINETFPRIVAGIDKTQFQHTTWNEFEELYSDVGPENYVWYQSKIEVEASRVYAEEGLTPLKRLWNAFAISDGHLYNILCKDISVVFAALLHSLQGSES